MSNLAEKLLLSLSRDPKAAESDAQRCGSREEDPFWVLNKVFSDFHSVIQGKRVLDFGSGWGYQSVALAEAGAEYVVGVDTNLESLKKAEELLSEKGLQDKVKYLSALPEEMLQGFDIVISHNSFEHFPDPGFILSKMKEALKPQGQILITFGPPWLAPYGAHMRHITKIPWVNIFFSEKTVMNVRALFRDDGAKRYEDVVGGLNKMTVAKFERTIADSGLKVEYKRYDCIKNLNFLGKIPYIRELFINHISCICSI